MPRRRCSRALDQPQLLQPVTAPRATTDIFGKAFGLPVVDVSGLEEMDVGPYEGIADYRGLPPGAKTRRSAASSRFRRAQARGRKQPTAPSARRPCPDRRPWRRVLGAAASLPVTLHRRWPIAGPPMWRRCERPRRRDAERAASGRRVTAIRIRPATPDDRDFMFDQAQGLVRSRSCHRMRSATCSLPAPLMNASFARPASESRVLRPRGDNHSPWLCFTEASTDFAQASTLAYVTVLAITAGGCEGRGVARRA